MLRSLILIAGGAALATALNPPPTALRVEYVQKPEWALISTPTPVFSWVPGLLPGTVQSAWQVQVFQAGAKASDPFFDSGRVESDAINVQYSGPHLPADFEGSFRVRTWDSQGYESSWSNAFDFVVGPMAAGDWHGAAWISCNQTGEMDPVAPTAARNRFRAEAKLPAGKTVTRARLYVAGTGYVRAWVSGRAADPLGVRMQAGWKGFRQRVLYTSADMTEAVKEGAATAGTVVLAMELGNGWADVLPAPWNGTVSSHGAEPWFRAGAVRKAVAQLRLSFNDGSSAVLLTNASGAPVVAFAGDDSPRSHAAPEIGAPAGYRSRTTAPLPSETLDAVWQCGGGPRVNDSVYDGETFDARRQTPGWAAPGWDPSGSPVATTWGAATAALPFSSAIVLSAQAMPPVKTQMEFRPILVNRTADPAPGQRRWTFDFGQNLAGATRLYVGSGVPAGAQFTIQHGEALMHPPYGPVDGTIYTANLRSAKATDVYIHDGSTVSHEFGMATYHGFRYAQLTVEGTGDAWEASAGTLTAVNYRSDVEKAGSFAAGDANGLYNAIHHACSWSLANNMMSIFSDCHQRSERKSWSGDAALSTETFYLNYDVPAFMRQWVLNLRDQQLNPYQPPHGNSVGDTSPLTFGAAPGDPSWQTAYPTAVHWQAVVAGDSWLASDFYNPLQLYLDDLTTMAQKDGLGKMFARYGEWVTPTPTVPTNPDGASQGPKPPKSLISAFNYIKDIDRLAELSVMLNHSTEAIQYRDLANRTRADFVNAFWDASIQAFGAGNGDRDGLQTSNTVALVAGALKDNNPTPAFASLVNDIVGTHDGHIAVGITGSKFLWPTLVEHGRADLAVSLSLSTEYPSFGWNIHGGLHGYEPATTMWELWAAPELGPGMNSRCHHMFAAIDRWFYTQLAGLSACEGAVSYSCVSFWPRVTTEPQLPWANATIPTARGPASLSWSNTTSLRSQDAHAALPVAAATPELTLQADLPSGGATGVIVVPVDSASYTITVNGQTVWAHGTFQPGVKLVTKGEATADGVRFEVGPGGSFAVAASSVAA